MFNQDKNPHEVKVPIACPKCGGVALTQFPISVVVIALTSWRQMRLYAACCPLEWDATAADLQAIEDYLGASWLEFERQRFADETTSLLHAARGPVRRIG